MQKTSGPYVQEVDTQYGFEGKRWATAIGARGLCLRREEKHQLDPGDQKVHLHQELALARSLSYLRIRSRPGSVSLYRR